MIYLRLAGGLGNQMYQIAAAGILSARVGQKVTLLTAGLDSYQTKREPDSLMLLAEMDWIENQEVKITAIERMFALSLRGGRWLPQAGINDKNFWRFYKKTKKTKSPLIMDGYFQKGWGAEEFKLALERIKINGVSDCTSNLIAKDEAVIHVRGGDFLKLSNFQVVNEEYYIKAISLALLDGWNSFAVVSDDLAYAQTILRKVEKCIPQVKIRFISANRTAIEDFEILRSAGARIIGNSTFAWWAGALSIKNGPTWSPNKFCIAGGARDFYLNNEIQIAV